MLATRPPGRTISVHIWKRCREPRPPSTATSTPHPSVNAMTCSFHSGEAGFTPSVAPNFFASSTRSVSRSTAMIRDAPYKPAVATTASPTGPAPTTATTSPGLTCPYWTPISNPVGKMSEHHPLLVGDGLWHLVHRCLGVWHPHVLGLSAVDQMAEHPANPGRSSPRHRGNAQSCPAGRSCSDHRT